MLDRFIAEPCETSLGVDPVDRLDVAARQDESEERRRRFRAPFAGEQARIREDAVELHILDVKATCRGVVVSERSQESIAAEYAAMAAAHRQFAAQAKP